MNTPITKPWFVPSSMPRSIFNGHVGFGSRDPAETLERLRAALDRAELIPSLNRMNPQ